MLKAVNIYSVTLKQFRQKAFSVTLKAPPAVSIVWPFKLGVTWKLAAAIHYCCVPGLSACPIYKHLVSSSPEYKIKESCGYTLSISWILYAGSVWQVTSTALFIWNYFQEQMKPFSQLLVRRKSFFVFPK